MGTIIYAHVKDGKIISIDLGRVPTTSTQDMAVVRSILTGLS